MSRKEALTDLLAKVEAGETTRLAVEGLSIPALDLTDETMARAINSGSAYNGSLDAAKALHEAVLPGWTPSVGQNAHHRHWFAHVMRAEGGAIVDDVGSPPSTDPARAWLIAILRALIAECEA